MNNVNDIEKRKKRKNLKINKCDLCKAMVDEMELDERKYIHINLVDSLDMVLLMHFINIVNGKQAKSFCV